MKTERKRNKWRSKLNKVLIKQVNTLDIDMKGATENITVN